MALPVYMTYDPSITYEYAVEFTLDGFLTATQYDLCMKILTMVADQFKLELVETEVH